ncbi:MAG: aquaporin [Candidatus Limnocylindrales bacterium]
MTAVGSVDVRSALAELIGAFVFLFTGFMGVTAMNSFTAASGVPAMINIALAFGLGLFVAIQFAGVVSGGHFNPAVTIAAVADKRIDVANGVLYIVAQIAGGIAAALVLGAIFDQATVKSVVTAPGGGVTDIEALVLETLFTAVFLAVILTVTRRTAAYAAFVIPAALVVIHFALVPFTGSSVNPARSIGPALVGGDTTSLWIYLVGPVVGGLIGWAVYRVFTPPDTATA